MRDDDFHGFGDLRRFRSVVGRNCRCYLAGYQALAALTMTTPGATEAVTPEQRLAREIYTAWMRDDRFMLDHSPQAFFWAELAAKSAIRSLLPKEEGK